MIVSMTGFGKAARTFKRIKINVEMRSVNSKYLEISSRIPIAFSDKENEIKEIIGKGITRGKINVAVTTDRNGENSLSLRIQPEIIKDYYKLLTQIKKTAKLKEDIKIEHLLKFSEIFKPDENDELKDHWNEVKATITHALDDLYKMKVREGKQLEKDMLKRINLIENKLNKIVKTSDINIKNAKVRFTEKVNNLLNKNSEIDKNRLEFEIVMLADRMDITEEVIRTKSHLKYFRNNLKESELSGRRLNFLVQEINREINTIASKSNNSDISQNVVEMKEELEKIKEQLQNVE
jgi:uncharacterized protein (TIGR00255 family)